MCKYFIVKFNKTDRKPLTTYMKYNVDRDRKCVEREN